MPVQDNTKAKERKSAYNRKYYNSERRQARLRTHVGHAKIPDGEMKREYNGYCELCGATIPDDRHKAYHHWDDDLLAMGIWLCYKCHKAVHFVERGLAEEYYALKARIEKDYALKQIKKLVDLGIVSEVDLLKTWGQ